MKTLLDKHILFKDPDYKHKVLLFDIETAPNIGAYFELYKEGNIVWNEQYWYILCFSYKWLGDKETHVVALPDFKLWKKDKTNDLEVVKVLWKLFDEAEVIIAHNGNSFDIKKSNVRFLKHGMEAPSAYKQIDTKLLAKRYFKFDSNKLDDLGDFLNIGRKLETEKGLWKDCMDGSPHAWKMMKQYNIQDTILLEKVYYKLRGWDKIHPNMNLILGSIFNCPICGSDEINKRGYSCTRTSIYQRYQCMNCGGWSQGEVIKRDKPLK